MEMLLSSLLVTLQSWTLQISCRIHVQLPKLHVYEARTLKISCPIHARDTLALLRHQQSLDTLTLRHVSVTPLGVSFYYYFLFHRAHISFRMSVSMTISMSIYTSKIKSLLIIEG